MHGICACTHKNKFPMENDRGDSFPFSSLNQNWIPIRFKIKMKTVTKIIQYCLFQVWTKLNSYSVQNPNPKWKQWPRSLFVYNMEHYYLLSLSFVQIEMKTVTKIIIVVQYRALLLFVQNQNENSDHDHYFLQHGAGCRIKPPRYALSIHAGDTLRQTVTG